MERPKCFNNIGKRISNYIGNKSNFIKEQNVYLFKCIKKSEFNGIHMSMQVFFQYKHKITSKNQLHIKLWRKKGRAKKKAIVKTQINPYISGQKSWTTFDYFSFLYYAREERNFLFNVFFFMNFLHYCQYCQRKYTLIFSSDLKRVNRSSSECCSAWKLLISFCWMRYFSCKLLSSTSNAVFRLVSLSWWFLTENCKYVWLFNPDEYSLKIQKVCKVILWIGFEDSPEDVPYNNEWNVRRSWWWQKSRK